MVRRYTRGVDLRLAWLVLALLSGLGAGARAQGLDPAPLRPVQPLDLRRPESGLEVLVQEGLCRRVTWRSGPGAQPMEVPLHPPVRDLEAGLHRDSGILVLLAGGVQANEPLTIHLLGRNGRRQVLDTSGGSRLPARFNDGLGSWPLVEGEHVVLLAYLRAGRIEFRALDLNGHLHAVRSFPTSGPTLSGFRAEADPVTSEVRVFFAGEPQPLVFPHPLAPRVELERSLLDFGRVVVGSTARATLEVRNTGGRPLQMDLELEAGPFQWIGAAVVEVPPGESLVGEVRFRPRNPGPVQERLVLQSNAANGQVAVALRGEGGLAREPEPPTTAPAPTGGEPAAEPRAEPAGAAPAPDVAPPPSHPTLRMPPRVLGLEIVPAGEGRVRVSGALAESSQGAQIRLRASSGHRTVAEVAPAGAFAAELRATPGDGLFAAWTVWDGPPTREVLLGRVLPFLVAVDGPGVEIRGWPGAPFTLFSVVPDPDGDGIDLVLDAWDGKLGPDGTTVVDLARVGGVPCWLLARVGEGDLLSRTNLLGWQR